MIDLELLMQLMGTPDGHRLDDQEKPSFLDHCEINESGISAEYIDNHTFQIMTEGERVVWSEFRQDIALELPCSIAGFSSWILRNSFQDLLSFEISDHKSTSISIARIHAKHRPKQLYIEEFLEKVVPKWDGELESLSTLLQYKLTLENERQKTEKIIQTDKLDLDTEKNQSRLTKINLKLLDIDNAINHEYGNARPMNESRQSPRKRQFEIIQNIVTSLGYEIMKVPVGGKSIIKKICLEEYKGIFTTEGFNGAWKEFSKKGKLSIANKESFGKRH